MTGDTASLRRSLPAFIRTVPPLLCALLLVACGSSPKRGGYYQNDGPPDRAPAERADAAEVVPRVEPLLARANRPYVALGRRYTPLTGDVAFRQQGTASWYGRQFHGNRTASGEIYDMYALTAAHPTLPIPSYARVTHARNGRSLIVRVNDRGPFKDGRVIDLSYGAALRLGIVGSGTAEVEVERLTFEQIASGAWRRGAEAAAGDAVPSPAASNSAPAAGAARWSVQVGAFAQQASAEDFAARVATVLDFSDDELPAAHREPRVERDDNLFRVLVGAFQDRASALALAQQLERLLGRPALPLAR